jgi:hypothetical protein
MIDDAGLLRCLEERLFDSAVRRSAADVDALLADEFLEFGRSGRVYDKRQIIELMRDEAPAERSLSDFEARPLAPGVVLLTYRSTAQMGAEPPRRTLRSSVWKLDDGHWRFVLHQGTPLSET